jgi:hypothetical protein
MGLCRDQLTKELQSKGYSVVRLPRSGIEPLDIYGIDGKDRQPLGRLEDLWISLWPQNDIEIKTGDVSDLSVRETDSMKFRLAFDLLSKVFAGHGWDAPKLENAYSKAHRLKIVFNSPTFRQANALQLGKYIIDGDLHIRSPVVQRYFFTGDCYAIVITEVLQSKSITLEAVDAKGSELSIDASLIEGLSNASLVAKADQSREGVVTYTGSAPVTFAFKAVAILIDGGSWTIDGIDPTLTLGPGGGGKSPIMHPPLDPDGLTDLG